MSKIKRIEKEVTRKVVGNWDEERRILQLAENDDGFPGVDMKFVSGANIVFWVSPNGKHIDIIKKRYNVTDTLLRIADFLVRVDNEEL